MMGNNKVTSIFLCLFFSTIFLACTDDHNAGNAVHKAGVTLNKPDIDFVKTGVVASSAIAQTYPILIGDYLSVEYINVLQKTHSPLTAAEESDGRQYIPGKMLDNEPNFTVMGGFHQGLGGFGINSAGKIDAHSFGKQLSGIKILNNKEFILMFDDKDLTYRYVGNLNQFIASQTIVGKYKSDIGELYTFTVEGTATYPGKTFQYKVFSDYVMVGFDSFFEVKPKGGGKVYGFKLIKNKLQLFNMGGPMGDEPEDKPFVTLTRIGDEEGKAGK